ncbi:FecCD family ABC transporter permease [Algihabitans sp.]|uniref:FecCD family ABC transporter permease n=1 Tax=Algihabitans sp. TaxID=2821514 RepID=UPI003BACA2C5
MSDIASSKAQHPTPWPQAGVGTARSRTFVWLTVVSVLVIAAFFATSVLVGRFNTLSVADLIGLIFDYDNAEPLDQVSWNRRFPRVAVAVIAGASMGAAGALIQAVVRNPLASPGILGFSQGAVAAVVMFATLVPEVTFGALWFIRPGLATLGGLLAAAIVYSVSRSVGSVESERLILIGIVVGGIFSSVTTCSLIFADQRDVSELLRWLTGSLDGRSWSDLGLISGTILLTLPLVILSIGRANAIQLGDEIAVGLGQRRELDRVIVLIAVVALSGAAVAINGTLGFIGLLGPHIVRRFVGNDTRRLVPAAALAGAAILVSADTAARLIDLQYALEFLGLEGRDLGALPVGIYLNLIGLPFLIYLIRKNKRKGHK